MFRRAVAATALALAVAAPAAPALAYDIVGLTADKRLVWFPDNATEARGTARISGIANKVVGIDFRPKDKMLYGLDSAGNIFSIVPQTGAATWVSKMNKPLEIGAAGLVDFNPAADRLRVVGANGASYRINVDNGETTVDGSLKYADDDMNRGRKSGVTAGAYTNAFAGIQGTALHHLDSAHGTFVTQAPPNDGILKTVGKSGIKGRVQAMDIVTDAQGGNVAMAVAGNQLYRVDIATGSATPVARLGASLGGLTDIAIMPVR
jgi:hypothetical protein